MKNGKGKLHNLLVNFGFTDEEYSSIRLELVKENSRTLSIASLVEVTYFIVIGILAFLIGKPFSSDYFYLYFIFAIISLFIYVLNAFLIKKHPSLLKYLVYLFVTSTLVFGIGAGTFLDRETTALTFHCLIILLPLLFADRPFRTIGSIILFSILFIIASIFTKEQRLWVTDIFNTVMFSIIVIFASLFLNKIKITKLLSEYKLKRLADVDALTNVYNRNAYENDLFSLPSLAKNTLSCIYIDVNGLHEVNNKNGHDAGDEMLKCIANIIIKFCPIEHTYRIGGDEFIVFIPDTISSEVIANGIEKEVRDEGFSVSIGVLTMETKDLDIRKLVRKSEVVMFRNKDNYYQEKGYARR